VGADHATSATYDGSPVPEPTAFDPYPARS